MDMHQVIPMVQVRSAYRRRGWGFTDPQQISQCAKEGFVEKLKAQEGEGCHMWGTLAVNKVKLCKSHAMPLAPMPENAQDSYAFLVAPEGITFRWLPQWTPWLFTKVRCFAC